MNFIYILIRRPRNHQNHQKSEHGEQGENKANYLSSACSGPYERQVVEIVLIYRVIMVIYAFLDDVYGHMFQLVYKFALFYALHQILFGFALLQASITYVQKIIRAYIVIFFSIIYCYTIQILKMCHNLSMLLLLKLA